MQCVYMHKQLACMHKQFTCFHKQFAFMHKQCVQILLSCNYYKDMNIHL